MMYTTFMYTTFMYTTSMYTTSMYTTLLHKYRLLHQMWPTTVMTQQMVMCPLMSYMQHCCAGVQKCEGVVTRARGSLYTWCLVNVHMVLG